MRTKPIGTKVGVATYTTRHTETCITNVRVTAIDIVIEPGLLFDSSYTKFVVLIGVQVYIALCQCCMYVTMIA